MDATQALLFSTIGVSGIFATFAYLIILRITSQPGAGGGAVGGGTGTSDPPPPVTVKPRFTGITATSFGGSNDRNASAYGGSVNGDGLGVALPDRFTGTRPRVRVFYNGKTCDCDIVDIGPWNYPPHADPYWTTNSRPEAESGTDNTGRATNLAGIDLTPGAWSALGVSNPDSVKTKVDWDFVNVLDAAPKVTTTPPPVNGTPPWIILGRIYDGLVWHKGQPMPTQIVAWMDAIAAKFPDMQAYVNALKAAGKTDWWPWCGGFVQSMLAPYGIRGPMSAAGLTGETTVNDWAYAHAWADWGTDASDNPQPGDVLVWSFGHVSFYDHLEPDTDTYASLGGDQGTPLRVCLEDISMGSCIAIRRPPVS